ncbi:GntR family transcriptional regulator [Amylibacter sp. SFDW26]|uniref:GntR family transcriptional regulator n=1 Tax=Amylibacter sp. SFDW26 TaxID=2652722 RepID=UPI0012628F84|nr:GntR family transcriptional regulator [Amylibacter sp. SFDW26]KAB7615669.1 GntR family transcriptional regulator [Amylibacter sp. SFDW26]
MGKLSIKSEVIAETLVEEIIRGEFEQGARLGQDHLAERFECSHVPVREALQKLIQMELATSEPRRGVRVVSLGQADHAEILDMRLALEPLALRGAVHSLNSNVIGNINVLRDECDAAKNAIEWEKANRAFHYAILAPCGQPRLLQRIAELQRLSAHRFHALWRKQWVQMADREHAALVHAMARGDADAACTVLTKHLRRQ